MFCQLRHNGRRSMPQVLGSLTMRVRTSLHIRIRCTDSALCHCSVCVLLRTMSDLSRLHPQICERPLGIQFGPHFITVNERKAQFTPPFWPSTIIHRHPCPIRRSGTLGIGMIALNPGVGCIYRWSSNGFLP